MAQLYEAMVGDDADQAVGDDLALAEDAADEDESVQRASMMLTRILFLLYGDDAGLWEADLFHRWVEQRTDADNLGAQLHSLFGVLNTPTGKRNKNLGDLLPASLRQRRPVHRSAAVGVLHPGMRDALGSVPVPVDPHLPSRVRRDVSARQEQRGPPCGR